MLRDSVRQIFTEYPWLYVFAWGGLPVVGYLILRDMHPIHFNAPSFKSLTIASSIKEIKYYSRGAPRVIMSDGRSILLKVPGAGEEYVQANDSIVKRAGTDSVTVYRDCHNYTEVSVFGYGNDDGRGDLGYRYSCLLKRYIIINNI